MTSPALNEKELQNKGKFDKKKIPNLKPRQAFYRKVSVYPTILELMSYQKVKYK